MPAAKYTPIFNRVKTGETITVDSAAERLALLKSFGQWRASRPHAANFRAKSKFVDGKYEITFIGQHPEDARRAAMIAKYGEPK